MESVGGTVDPSIEKVAALRPDPVFMSSLGPKLRDQLQNDLKLNVYVVSPKNFPEVYDNIRQIELLLDAGAAADGVVRDMRPDSA